MENSTKAKVTNRKLIECSGIVAQISQKRLPPKMSFTLARNTEHTDSIMKTYFKEKQKIVDKYVTKDNEGNPKITENKMEFVYKGDTEKAAFVKEHDQLLDYVNEVEIRKITLSDLEHLEEVRESHPELKYDTFTAAELRAIDYMIEE